MIVGTIDAVAALLVGMSDGHTSIKNSPPKKKRNA